MHDDGGENAVGAISDVAQRQAQKRSWNHAFYGESALDDHMKEAKKECRNDDRPQGTIASTKCGEQEPTKEQLFKYGRSQCGRQN